MAKDDQICPGETPTGRKVLKKRAGRKARQAAKKDPDVVQTKRRYRGWSR